MKVLISAIFLVFVINVIYGSKCPKIGPCDNKNIKNEIDEAVKSHTVTVFSRTTCPFSKRVKKILRDNYKIKDLFIFETDLHEDTCKILDCLNTETEHHTVPQVFVAGKFVGNHDTVKKLFEEGKLDEILTEAHAI